MSLATACSTMGDSNGSFYIGGQMYEVRVLFVVFYPV